MKKSATKKKEAKSGVMRVFLALAAVGTLYLVGASWQSSLDGGDEIKSSEVSLSGQEMKVLKSDENAKIGAVMKAEKRGLVRVGSRQKAGREISFYIGGEWNQSLTVPKFWIPTEVTNVEYGDARVHFCKLDIDNYWRNPSRTPMFRDLVSWSRCGAGRTGSLAKSYKEVMAAEKKPLTPTAFIFHESRVGSTLIANMLASVPTNLVFSESAPPTAILNHCRSCSPEKKIEILRQVIGLMGASPFHTRLFFKFQSITVPNIAILSAAFPHTPWIFVYREPVQVIMSHFKHGAGRSAPCIREHRRPRAETARILDLSQAAAARVSPEKYCAAHLAMLCESALRNDREAGKLALMLNYDTLPGSLVHYVLPKHFHVNDLDYHEKRRMLDVASVYSKLRKPLVSVDPSKSAWSGDSKAKEDAASTQIHQAADSLLASSFARLKQATLDKTDGDSLSQYARLTLENSVL